ncbi:hypothetical protein MTP99_001131 [Tenebrio molitor]|jgi:hypothetical protein|nr:hypothetical protein MTP99_001131 [Tenebrio molitor]
MVNKFTEITCVGIARLTFAAEPADGSGVSENVRLDQSVVKFVGECVVQKCRGVLAINNFLRRMPGTTTTGWFVKQW